MNRIISTQKLATLNFKLLNNTIRNVTQQTNQQLDDLLKNLQIEVRGHDPKVLESYLTFVSMVANELDIKKSLTGYKPDNGIKKELDGRFIERWTLLRSKFGNKKHRRQYEMRTHFNEMNFEQLTGSTCDTFLEYIERNLPEGI
jgi:small subunit ribosomal protein S10